MRPTRCQWVKRHQRPRPWRPFTAMLEWVLANPPREQTYQTIRCSRRMLQGEIEGLVT